MLERYAFHHLQIPPVIAVSRRSCRRARIAARGSRDHPHLASGAATATGPPSIRGGHCIG